MESQGSLVQLVQLLALKPNTFYRASVWMRSQSPMDVTVMLRQTGEPYTSYLEESFSLTSQWKKYQFEGEVGGISSEAFFMIISEQSGVFWVDDASLSNQLTNQEGLSEPNIDQVNDDREEDNTRSGGGSASLWLLMSLFFHSVVAIYKSSE